MVTASEWRAPAREPRAHARAATPLGMVVLVRGPALRGGVEALTEGWEEWRLSLDGRDLMTVHDLGAPGPPARRRARRTVHGLLLPAVPGSGAAGELTLTARRSLRAARRAVALSGPFGVLTFRRQRLEVVLLDSRGQPLARLGAEGWRGTALADPVVLGAVCPFHWAELADLLPPPGSVRQE
ncbi:hypothetical protein ACIGXM_19360 [Kitasatospora sp. NPDC052896]|uniref:hypothetical protein n=1 Tax=Kitasatospora sp. NPDC052896 TaxID=3364061 RepID=UPI0037C888DD